MVVEVLATKAFQQAISQHEYPKAVYSKIRLLAEHSRHPSLGIQLVNQVKERTIWECYVTHNDRLLFERRPNQLILWYLGTHAMTERASQLSFHENAHFSPLGLDVKVAVPPTIKSAASVLDGSTATKLSVETPPAIPDPSPNRFQYFEGAHLRILGVPASMVPRLKQTASLEEAIALPELPRLTRRRLEELSTSKELYNSLFDDSLLTFRTTLDSLEHYCGGKIRHLMLNIQPEQQQFIAREFPPFLLTGSAGTGKTTIGIYRAIRLATQGRRVLFLTFNRTLSIVTKSLIVKIHGSLPPNLHIKSLYQQMIGLLRDRSVNPDVAGEDFLHEMIQGTLEEVRARSKSTVLQRDEMFFEEEIKYVIKGLGIGSLEEYKKVKRYGRETALQPKPREAVWEVYEGYQRRLGQAKQYDWSDIALETLHVLQARPIRDPYDEVIVDEAQDLTPVALRVIQYFAKPVAGHTTQKNIVLLADAAQTLYSRNPPWKQAGLDARGRTLKKNHRNTYQIAEAAAHLLKQNVLLRQLNEYIDPELSKRHGPPPLLVETMNVFPQQFEWVKDRIRDLLSDQTFHLSDFAVLCPTRDLCSKCALEFERSGLPAVVQRRTDFDLLSERIKVLTIHSAKGLEFPVVFLVGLIEGLLPITLSPQQGEPGDDESQISLEQQRALCYVGMTRASDALYLLTTTGKKSRFVYELAGKILRW